MSKLKVLKGCWLTLFIGSSGLLIACEQVLADVQLPANEIPEEVLRTEIIFEARSPLDGSPMTASDYAVLQAELQAPPETVKISPTVRQLIFLLQLRGAIRPVLPLLP